MAGDDEMPCSDDGLVIERGETYDHDGYGKVEVTGIWRGIQRVDEARNMDEKDVIIARYSTEQEDGLRIDELTDTFPEFLEAIN